MGAAEIFHGSAFCEKENKELKIKMGSNNFLIIDVELSRQYKTVSSFEFWVSGCYEV